MYCHEGLLVYNIRCTPECTNTVEKKQVMQKAHCRACECVNNDRILSHRGTQAQCIRRTPLESMDENGLRMQSSCMVFRKVVRDK